MAQVITPALEAILKSKLQAGPDGFRARIELDNVLPGTEVIGEIVDVNLLYGTDTAAGTNPPTNPEYANDGNSSTSAVAAAFVSGNGTFTNLVVADLGIAYDVTSMHWYSQDGTGNYLNVIEHSADGAAWTPITTLTDDHGATNRTITFATLNKRYFRLGRTQTFPPGLFFVSGYRLSTWEIFGATVELVPPTIVTVSLVPLSIVTDKSLNLVADTATIEFENEALPLGWGLEGAFPTNTRCRVFQWYGDPANETQTFLGVVDRLRHSRDPLRLALTARDLMAILIDQTFSATAPQGAGEAGAVRTVANGVYLSMEVSDIVYDIVVNQAGWPAANVAISPTSYVVDEFIVRDGASWAATIIGKEQLTGLVGYSAWADELGVFHFAPTLVTQSFTEPLTAAYILRSGEDVTELDDEVDQYELRTRVKARGPLTTQVLTDTWRELWRTGKISKPVGIWYDPAEPAIIKVISRATKRIYRLRQSDRVILGSSYVGGVIPYPLGISGDPSDATIFWVLNAPWIYTGSSGGNSVKKVRKSDYAVLASYPIPNGRWSALKVSGTGIWLTNLDTDRFYKRSKTDASAIADYSHTYGGNPQLNPSGIMVDGTTLFLFWSNGGTTARFLVADESAPGTVVKAIKTAGTALHGGEMDTTTHTECYGDSDSLNLVGKFTLVAVVDQTNEVYAEVIDTALEDELGGLAQLSNRTHDAHPAVAAHPFEVRRLTLDLEVVTSLAQATETAQRQLDIASQRREVVDVGMTGKPHLQKTDVVGVVDPVTGESRLFVLDSLRTRMSPSGYLGTGALLPLAALDDTPVDDGDAGGVIDLAPDPVAVSLTVPVPTVP